MSLQQSPGSAAAYITMGMSFIMLVNPLTTIYFVRPFRNAALNMFYGKTRTSPVTTSASAGRTASASVQGKRPSISHTENIVA
ncbi:hypothetical protein AAVH_10720 [Aphelenchoides avenae]|nr:hypothetical protein AAVH_10720 [Aphelenchus avenae]